MSNSVHIHQAPKPITLTQPAIQHIQQLLAKKPQNRAIRLAIKKNGCTGYGYHLELITDWQETDHVFPIDDKLLLIVDPTSYLQVQGTEIDYVREGLNSQFAYRNPNATATCGCGESFTTQMDNG